MPLSIRAIDVSRSPAPQNAPKRLPRRGRAVKPRLEHMEARALLAAMNPAAVSPSSLATHSAGDTPGITETIRLADLNVYVNNSAGYFTADMLARVNDAIKAWDAVLSPYNVAITRVGDPRAANLVLTSATDSVSGGFSAGVLGSYNPNASPARITIIQGWNWFAGPDASSIGARQFDFQTTVTHELGHALGLGGSDNNTSPLMETLRAGTARRVVTPQDLDSDDPVKGPDPQIVNVVNVSSPSTSLATLFAQESLAIALHLPVQVPVGMISNHSTGFAGSATSHFVAATSAGRSLVAQPLLSRNPRIRSESLLEAGSRMAKRELDGEISLERDEAEFRGVFNSSALKLRARPAAVKGAALDAKPALLEKHDGTWAIVDSALGNMPSVREAALRSRELAESSNELALPLVLAPGHALPTPVISPEEECDKAAEDTNWLCGLVYVAGFLGTGAGLWRTGTPRAKRPSFRVRYSQGFGLRAN